MQSNHYKFFKEWEPEGVEVCEDGYSLLSDTYVGALEEALSNFGVVVKKVDNITNNQ